MKNVYYLKILYFNAGKNLLTDNFLYCKNLVCRDIITQLCKIGVKNKKNKNLFFHDLIGCAGHCFVYEYEKISGDNGPFFIYSDSEIDGCAAGFYSREKNLFIFNDKWSVLNKDDTVELNKRYCRRSGRKYTTGQYIALAKSYFDKSEYIAIATDL